MGGQLSSKSKDGRDGQSLSMEHHMIKQRDAKITKLYLTKQPLERINPIIKTAILASTMVLKVMEHQLTFGIFFLSCRTPVDSVTDLAKHWQILVEFEFGEPMCISFGEDGLFAGPIRDERGDISQVQIMKILAMLNRNQSEVEFKSGKTMTDLYLLMKKVEQTHYNVGTWNCQDYCRHIIAGLQQ